MIDYERIMEDNAKKRSGVADNMNAIDQSLRHMPQLAYKRSAASTKICIIGCSTGYCFGPTHVFNLHPAMILLKCFLSTEAGSGYLPTICMTVVQLLYRRTSGQPCMGADGISCPAGRVFLEDRFSSETTSAYSTWALISEIIRDGPGVCFVVPTIDYETPSGVCIANL